MLPGQEEKALKAVPERLVESLKAEIGRSRLDLSETKLVILEGFLLFHNLEIGKRLDLKFLCRLSHDVAKRRRFNRQGYGLEAKPGELWKTEDYFEKMVWRFYRELHALTFRDRDVEGEVNEEASQNSQSFARLGSFSGGKLDLDYKRDHLSLKT